MILRSFATIKKNLLFYVNIMLNNNTISTVCTYFQAVSLYTVFESIENKNIAKYFLPDVYTRRISHLCITADICCYYASRRVLSRAENRMNMISNEELDDEVR